MSNVIDFDFVQTYDANGYADIGEERLPTDYYYGLAIGPNSEHDIVRVLYPGMSVRLMAGQVLTLPSSAQKTKVVVDIETVRAFSGRVQVVGFTSAEELQLAAKVRTPHLVEAVETLVQNVPLVVELPFAGRSSVNLSATIGGAGGVGVGPLAMTVATHGKIYRRDASGAVVTGETNYILVPLNTPTWSTTMRDFSWNECEPQFDALVFTFTNTDAASQDIYYHAEVRD